MKLDEALEIKWEQFWAGVSKNIANVDEVITASRKKSYQQTYEAGFYSAIAFIRKDSNSCSDKAESLPREKKMWDMIKRSKIFCYMSIEKNDCSPGKCKCDDEYKWLDDFEELEDVMNDN